MPAQKKSNYYRHPKHKQALRASTDTEYPNKLNGERKNIIERGTWADLCPNKNYYKWAHRYLQSKIGQEWDKIYSEICHKYPKKKDDTRKQVLLDQIYFPNDPFLQRGYVGNCFCVDEEGILIYRQMSIKHKSKPKQKLNWKDKKNLLIFKKINNIWYEVQLETCGWRFNWGAYDCVEQEFLKRYERFTIYGGDYVAIGKRQLNSKQIKKWQLR